MSNDNSSEEIYAVIGSVVARLLKPDQFMTLHEITKDLYHMSKTADTASVREACALAVKILARQMH